MLLRCAVEDEYDEDYDDDDDVDNSIITIIRLLSLQAQSEG